MIKQALSEQDLKTCLDIRIEVFVHEQGISMDEEIDDLDQDASHFLAYHEDKAVGTARIVWKADTAKIGRICLLESARGTGLGARLVDHTIQIAKARPGMKRAELGAQCYAIGFYEKLGFAAYGPVYDDAGIDHREMELFF